MLRNTCCEVCMKIVYTNPGRSTQKVSHFAHKPKIKQRAAAHSLPFSFALQNFSIENFSSFFFQQPGDDIISACNVAACKKEASPRPRIMPFNSDSDHTRTNYAGRARGAFERFLS